MSRASSISSDDSFEVVSAVCAPERNADAVMYKPMVIFHDIFDIYPMDTDIIARISFDEQFTKSPNDKIIVLPICWKTTKQALCAVNAIGDYVKIDVNDLPKNGVEDKFYQLCYYADSDKVVGVSMPFTFREVHEDELMEYQKEKNKEFWTFRSRFAVLMDVYWSSLDIKLNKDDSSNNSSSSFEVFNTSMVQSNIDLNKLEVEKKELEKKCEMLKKQLEDLTSTYDTHEIELKNRCNLVEILSIERNNLLKLLRKYYAFSQKLFSSRAQDLWEEQFTKIENTYYCMDNSYTPAQIAENKKKSNEFNGLLETLEIMLKNTNLWARTAYGEAVDDLINRINKLEDNLKNCEQENENLRRNSAVDIKLDYEVCKNDGVREIDDKQDELLEETSHNVCLKTESSDKKELVAFLKNFSEFTAKLFTPTARELIEKNIRLMYEICDEGYKKFEGNKSVSGTPEDSDECKLPTCLQNLNTMLNDSTSFVEFVDVEQMKNLEKKIATLKDDLKYCQMENAKAHEEILLLKMFSAKLKIPDKKQTNSGATEYNYTETVNYITPATFSTPVYYSASEFQTGHFEDYHRNLLPSVEENIYIKPSNYVTDTNYCRLMNMMRIMNRPINKTNPLCDSFDDMFTDFFTEFKNVLSERKHQISKIDKLLIKTDVLTKENKDLQTRLANGAKEYAKLKLKYQELRKKGNFQEEI